MTSEGGPRLKILEWKPLTRNSLRGFAKVRLPSGLILRDVTVHVSNGKAWAATPSKPILDQEGRHKTGDDGKKQYAFIVEWETRALSDGFSEAVTAVLDRDYAPWR